MIGCEPGSDFVLGFVSYYHFGFYSGVVYVPVTFLTIGIFDFSFPFVLSRFVPETLLCVLSSCSLPRLVDVGHIEVGCGNDLVICQGVCVSFSWLLGCGWWVGGLYAAYVCLKDMCLRCVCWAEEFEKLWGGV
jgi:hypothetical protein